MKPGIINGRWELELPEDRVEFHEARPGWEAERLASCAELMQPGMTVYDIGAESGDFTALYGLWVQCPVRGTGLEGPDECDVAGTVVPVDPQANYWPSIRQTWEANGLPPIEALFVGFASDETELHPALPEVLIEDEVYPRPGSLWPECAFRDIVPDYGFRHLSQQTDGTRQIRIDDMPRLLGAPAPDAIVMDIEGAELRALMGAETTLLKKRPIVWVSVHEPIMLDWYGHTLADLQGYMAEVGYRGEVLGTSGGEDYHLYLPRDAA